MIGLEPLQRAFADYLLGIDGRVRRQVRASSKASAEVLLQVYRNAYSARLVEVLGNDFPALKALAGETPFEAMARAYIAAHPSRGFSVRGVGAALTRFVEETTPYSDRPCLADMARFEWALIEAFDAADAEPIGVAAMTGLPPAAWPSLRLAFHSSLRIVALETRAPVSWLQHSRGEAVSEPPSGAADWLVWRGGLDLRFRDLARDESLALAAAMAGEEFADLCALLVEHGPEGQAAMRAAGLLRVWIEAGLVTGLSHESAVSH